MSSSVPVPAAEMTRSSDPQPGEPDEATTPDDEPRPVTAGDPRTAAAAATTRGAGPPAAAAGGGRPWVANALVAALTAAVTVVGGALGALLVHEFNSIDAKFVRLETEMDARFVRLEAEVDAGFAAQDAKIDEINLKLTALIAALNKTEEVDAALTGQLLDPDAAAEAGGSTGGGRAPASTS